MKYPIRAYVLDLLKEKYPGKTNPNLKSLMIYQTGQDIFLEKVFTNEPDKVVTENMNIIADDDFLELEPNISSSFFNPQLRIEENVRRFVEELDQYDIEMCFDGIFLENHETKQAEN